MHFDEIAALGAAGRNLWASLHAPEDPYALTALIVEAARVKDRLDAFARLPGNDAAALQEARHQATLLRQLVSEINRQKSGQGPGEDNDDDLDDL